jgi:DNA-binding response OmpR family regulator
MTDLIQKKELEEENTILIVDDSPDALNMMKKVLEMKKYSVLTASTGSQSIELFLNSEIQLMVIDFYLPDMNGIEILKKVRKYKTPEELPVIMITAQQSKTLLQEAIKSGVNDFILKPTRANDFGKRVESLLRKISHEDLIKILLSIHIPDPSTLNSESNNTLSSTNQTSFPFKIDNIDCCLFFENGKNPHMMAKYDAKTLEDEVVVIAKGGFLWNTIWPRKTNAKFLVTKESLNESDDLTDLMIKAS